MSAWAETVTAAVERPPVREFQAAADRARFHVETLEPTLAAEYERVLRAAGVRAAAQFRKNAALVAAAGDDIPNWTVPPVDSLIDVVQVTQDLLGTTAETREAAAIAATRPIMSAMGVSFSLEAPLVKDLVGRTGVRAAKISIPGLRDAVIAAMMEAFAEGLSVDQAAEAILEKTTGLAGYQATMLARTDLIGTANGGSILAAKVVYPEGTILKRWVNATNSDEINDGRIRPTHMEANGQTVPLDGYFVVGGDRLLYPGDPSGADEEVINCRCTLVYDEPLSDINAAAWDESRHPRLEAGAREGGRFRSKELGASVPSPSADTTAEVTERHEKHVYEYARRHGMTVPEYLSASTEWMRQQVAGEEIRIRAPIENVQGILDAGAFKEATAEELGWERAGMEEQYFGTEDPPVYGYVSGLPEDAGHSVTGYGDVAFRLKPEAAARSTVTLGDSANILVDIERTGQDIAITPFVAPTHLGVDYEMSGDVLGTTLRDFSGTYMEAQVWGGVKMSDVSEVVFLNEAKPTAAMITSMDRQGLKWSANDSQDPVPLGPEKRPKVGDVYTHRTWRDNAGEPAKMEVVEDYDTGVIYRLNDDAPDVRRGTSYRQLLHEAGIDLPALTAAAWDEAKHPREGAGRREGGRFRGGSEAAHRAREAKAMRDSNELDWAPDLEQHDRMPVETISEDDRGRARRALSYTSDDGLSLRVRDAQTWDDLVPEDRARLSRYLEDLQDETDHENLQPLIDRLKRAGVEPTLPPRGSYPMTAAAWDESRHPREERGRREGGRFRGGTVTQGYRAEHLGVGSRVKLTGNLADGKVYSIIDATPVGNAGHDVITLSDEAGNIRKVDGTIGVEHVPAEPEVPIHEEVVPETPPETIEVTGRSLKDGDRFTDGRGREWEVVASSGALARYVRVRPVDDVGGVRIMKSSTKVTVKAADHPAAAKRLAAANVSHVTGAYEGMFGKSTGPGSKVTKAMNAASAEAANVITLPDGLEKITLKETRSTQYGGAFTSTVRQGRVVPLDIALRAGDAKPDAMISNAHHEVGHYLDATAIVSAHPPELKGRAGYASDLRHPEVMGPVMDAIDNSAAAQRAKAVYESVSGRDATGEYKIVMNAGEQYEKAYAPDRSHARYVNEATEKWARAYEQYHATKSGQRLDRYREGAAMPAHDFTLDDGESAKAFYGWYWTPEDFAPISAEIDKMFGRLEWSKNS